MTHHRTIVLAYALAALPVLLVPLSAATGVEDVEPVYLPLRDAGLGDEASAACEPTPVWPLGGYVAISHLGSFPANGGALNGCDGDGCDDEVTGKLYSEGEYRDFQVREVSKWGASCTVDCFYDTGSHSFDDYRHGFVRFINDDDADRPHVYFACGTNQDSGGWVFGGRLYYGEPCEPEMGQPECP